MCCVRSDYGASIDEEKKNAVIKLHAEKTALKDENERLQRKVREMKDSGERSIG